MISKYTEFGKENFKESLSSLVESLLNHDITKNNFLTKVTDLLDKQTISVSDVNLTKFNESIQILSEIVDVEQFLILKDKIKNLHNKSIKELFNHEEVLENDIYSKYSIGSKEFFDEIDEYLRLKVPQAQAEIYLLDIKKFRSMLKSLDSFKEKISEMVFLELDFSHINADKNKEAWMKMAGLSEEKEKNLVWPEDVKNKVINDILSEISLKNEKRIT